MPTDGFLILISFVFIKNRGLFFFLNKSLALFQYLYPNEEYSFVFYLYISVFLFFTN